MRPSVWRQISGPVERSCSAGLAGLEYWSGRNASGVSRVRRSADRVVGVGVLGRHGGRAHDDLGAVRAQQRDLLRRSSCRTSRRCSGSRAGRRRWRGRRRCCPRSARRSCRPACSRPSRSAASIIATAGRSFTLPPGLNSLDLGDEVARRGRARYAPSRTSGVLPTRSRTESATSISPAIGHDGTLPPMQEHSFSIDVDAPPEEVWEVFWYRGARPAEEQDRDDRHPPPG